MRLFWKIFAGIFAFILLAYVLTVNFLIFYAFKSSFNQEKENGLAEARMYLYNFVSVGENLAEDYGMTDVVASKIADSLGKEYGNSFDEIYIYNTKKQCIYPESKSKDNTKLDTTNLEISNQREILDCVWSMRRQGERHTMEIIAALSLGKQNYYIQFVRDMERVYQERERFIAIYRRSLILMFVATSFFAFMTAYRIARPVRELSQATCEYTRGNLENRVKVRGNDEISDLMRDFNNMANHLAANIEELRESARRQEEFTGAFAHELKTPLTSVIGYSEMLLLDDMDEESRKIAAKYIHSEGKRLERLSHKMMELIQIDKISDELQEVNTQLMGEQIKNSVKFKLSAKNLKFKVQIEPAILFGDMDLLVSMLLNFIDNSYKACAEEGLIELSGYFEDEKYILSVKDDGYGMPKDEIHKITEVFYMVDKSRSRKQGGAGLGMAISRKIAENCGAELWIDSVMGEGTIVKVSFERWKTLEAEL